MNLFKIIRSWWQRRRDRFYHRNRWHLVLDFSLVIIILLLAGVAVRLAFYHPLIIETFHLNPPVINNPVSNNGLNWQLDIDTAQSAISLGEDLTLTLHYQNNSEITINQAEIRLDLTSAAFKITSIKTDYAEALSSGDKLIIKDIKPGERGDLALVVAWRVEKEDFPRSLQGKARVKLSNQNAQLEQELAFPVVKIASNLQMSAALYYHSPQGDQLGIGPVPPVVGVPTTYWLIVKAVNDGNDLKNAVFSAQLPVGVELSDEYSLLAGKFSYDSKARRLLWQLDSISAAGGDYIANFALVLTPSQQQLGKEVTILKNLRYHADDVWTQTELAGTLADLDSSLPADRLNRGNGVVIVQ